MDLVLYKIIDHGEKGYPKSKNTQTLALGSATDGRTITHSEAILILR
jgi:hypothetical protein